LIGAAVIDRQTGYLTSPGNEGAEIFERKTLRGHRPRAARRG
jgi:hypothetical protein